MPYRLRIGHDLGSELRRAAAEQLERGVAEIHDSELDADKTVHQVRKRLKKTRGALRLAMPDEYSEQNRRFREAGRKLAALRDQSVLLETLDDLVEAEPFDDEAAALERARERLAARQADVAAAEAALTTVERDLRRGLDQVRGWRPSGAGFDAVADGLERTYKRGRKALGKAYKNGSPEAFHEWRKRVKYHWMHVRLLQEAWPNVLSERARAAKRVGALLGDEHDLAVLRREARSLAGPDENWRPLERLIDRRSAHLRVLARPPGERLFVESPSKFGKRLRSLWEIAAAAA